jgi:hypothetical protein
VRIFCVLYNYIENPDHDPDPGTALGRFFYWLTIDVDEMANKTTIKTKLGVLGTGASLDYGRGRGTCTPVEYRIICKASP